MVAKDMNPTLAFITSWRLRALCLLHKWKNIQQYCLQAYLERNGANSSEQKNQAPPRDHFLKLGAKIGRSQWQEDIRRRNLQLFLRRRRKNGTWLTKARQRQNKSPMLSSTSAINVQKINSVTPKRRKRFLSGFLLRSSALSWSEELKMWLWIAGSVASKLSWQTVRGSGCSTGVEHTPHDREVVGSYPARCWAFFLFFILPEVCP